MPLFPIRTCVACGDEFELKPDNPGFANRCPVCSEPEEADSRPGSPAGAIEGANPKELDAERRRVMREMLYKKES